MIEIVYEEEKNRTAAYDKDKNIGKCTYVENGDIWILDHTIVDKEYGGRGIARELVRKLVNTAREKGKKIKPVCSYAIREFEKTEEYSDVKK